MADTSQTSDKEQAPLGSAVAAHYNQLQEAGLDQRTQSRIFYMRNFNNWIKSQLIAHTLERLGNAPVTVLDLGSGKGGDLLKWRKGNVKRVVCADIAATSVEQCQSRYKDLQSRAQNEKPAGSVFQAQFIAADCTKERLKPRYKQPTPQFDVTSCQFALHYSFESFEQAEMMVRNACECLRPGGYLIGTTPCSYELVKRLRKSDSMSFGNEVYRVTFTGEDKTTLPLFGAQYMFHLEGVVDCPEFLVYFPALEKMAARYGMRLVFRQTFAEFFDHQLRETHGRGRGLLGRMQGLEPYPAEEGVELMSKAPLAYVTAQAAHERLQAARAQGEAPPPPSGGYHQWRQDRPPKVGTLSQPEWEATSVYCVFSFQRMDPSQPAAPADTMDPSLPATGYFQQESANNETAPGSKTSLQDVTAASRKRSVSPECEILVVEKKPKPDNFD